MQHQTPCSSDMRFVSAMRIAATPHLLLCKVVSLVGHHILQAALPLRHALGGHYHAPGHPLLHHLRLVALHRQITCRAVSLRRARPHGHGQTTCCPATYSMQPQLPLHRIPASFRTPRPAAEAGRWPCPALCSTALKRVLLQAEPAPCGQLQHPPIHHLQLLLKLCCAASPASRVRLQQPSASHSTRLPTYLNHMMKVFYKQHWGALPPIKQGLAASALFHVLPSAGRSTATSLSVQRTEAAAQRAQIQQPM